MTKFNNVNLVPGTDGIGLPDYVVYKEEQKAEPQDGSLDQDEAQSLPEGDQAVDDSSTAMIVVVDPRVQEVMGGFGLSEMFQIKRGTPGDEVVDKLFSLAFARLKVAMKLPKGSIQRRKKAMWGAVRFPLGVLVKHFPGGLRKKMDMVHGEARMSPNRFDKLVFTLSRLGFIYEYDRDWYAECFHANLAEYRSRQVSNAQEADFSAMAEELASSAECLETRPEQVELDVAQRLADALNEFLSRQEAGNE